MLPKINQRGFSGSRPQPVSQFTPCKLPMLKGLLLSPNEKTAAEQIVAFYRHRTMTRDAKVALHRLIGSRLRYLTPLASAEMAYLSYFDTPNHPLHLMQVPKITYVPNPERKTSAIADPISHMLFDGQRITFRISDHGWKEWTIPLKINPIRPNQMLLEGKLYKGKAFAITEYYDVLPKDYYQRRHQINGFNPHKFSYNPRIHVDVPAIIWDEAQETACSTRGIRVRYIFTPEGTEDVYTCKGPSGPILINLDQ